MTIKFVNYNNFSVMDDGGETLAVYLIGGNVKINGQIGHLNFFLIIKTNSYVNSNLFEKYSRVCFHRWFFHSCPIIFTDRLLLPSKRDCYISGSIERRVVSPSSLFGVLLLPSLHHVKSLLIFTVRWKNGYYVFGSFHN